MVDLAGGRQIPLFPKRGKCRTLPHQERRRAAGVGRYAVRGRPGFQLGCHRWLNLAGGLLVLLIMALGVVLALIVLAQIVLLLVQ
jgi:hypothetical protein